MRNRQVRTAVLAALSSAATFATSAGLAGDIAFDGSLPGTAAGALNANNGRYSIAESRGLLAGSNLFHSFDVFNLDAGETAVFSGNAAITNIISRVTGGVPTTIDGTIRSTIQGANFWMVNPAGLTVGPSGAIDVSGAIALGAADSIDFADGRRFFAAPGNNDRAVRLFVANPVDFGFLGRSNAGKLEIHNNELLARSTLVADEQQIQPLTSNPTRGKFSLLLSGGSGVSLQSSGDLTLADARVRTGSVVTNGNGRFTGPIDLTAVGSIEIKDSDLLTSMAGGATGGDIFIQGGELVSISRSSLVTQSIDARVTTGDISIRGAGVLISDQARIATDFRAARGGTEGAGSGIISIAATGDSAETAPHAILDAATTGVVRIVDSAVVASNIGAQVRNDVFNATDTIRIGNERVVSIDGITVVPGADHVVVAGSLLAADATQGGIGGVIRIDSDMSVWIGDSNSGGYRAGGARSDIRSALSANASESAASPGSIVINAGNQLTFENARLDVSSSVPVSSPAGRSDGIRVISDGDLRVSNATLNGDNDNGSGGASIVLVGDTVHVSDSIVTATNTVRGSSTSLINGSGGRVSITAFGTPIQGAGAGTDDTTLRVTGTTIRTNSMNNGVPADDPFSNGAGEISIESRKGALEITDSTIEGQARGRGAGLSGAVLLSGTSVFASNLDVSIATETQSTLFDFFESGNNGIDVFALDSIVLSHSTLASTTSGMADAGNVTLLASNIDIRGSTLQTSTSGTGAGGVIQLFPTTFLASALNDPPADGLIPEEFLRISDSTLRASTSEVPASAGGISVWSAGSIDLNNATLDVSLAARPGSRVDFGGARGRITLMASGNSVSIVDSTLRATTSGSLRGGNIVAEGSSFLVRGSTITSASTVPARDLDPAASRPTTEGNIRFDMQLDPFFPSVRLGGAPRAEPGPFVIENSTVATNALGSDAGDITFLGAGSEFVLRESQVLASAGGGGQGGAIAIAGMTQATLQGSQIQSVAEAGAGGTISLSTGALTLDNTSIGSSASSANGGAIRLAAGREDLVLHNASIVASAGGSGTGGDITISAGGALVQSSRIQSLADAGEGGAITLTLAAQASGSLQLTDSQIANNAVAANGGNIALNANGREVLLQGSSLVASAGGAGNGGDISILNAAGASLRDVEIQAATLNGIGGTINLGLVAGAGGAVVLENSSITTNAMNASGGSISFDAAGHQVLVRNSAIVASAGGTGTGGGIAVRGAGGLSVQDSQFQALADAGVGGTINFKLSEGATGPLLLESSALTTNAARANGGSIALDAARQQVVLRDSSLVASAGGSGVGGGIAIVNAAGATLHGSQIQALADAGAGGAISIEVVNAASAALSLDNSSITTNATSADAGSIVLHAGGAPVTLRDSNLVASAGGSGTGGGISILDAGGAQLLDSQVQALAEAGRGGTIRINVEAASNGALQIDNSTVTTVATRSNGGNILLDAAGQQVVLRNSNIVASAGGDGSGGDIVLTNAGDTTIQGAQLQARAQAGSGGAINITRAGGEGTLLIDNSSITTNATHADGGSIALNAAGHDFVLRGSSVVASAGGLGEGGDIAFMNARAPRLVNSQVQALAESGTGGTISLNVSAGAGTVLIDNTAITANASNAAGGNIALDAAGNQLVLRGASIIASAGGTGAGGDISITNAGGAQLSDTQIQALADAGPGGTINLELLDAAAGPMVLERSAITTNAAAASGGNITLSAAGNPLILRDSTIRASAGVVGSGGNVLIDAVGFTLVQRSQVLARADAGNGGSIGFNLADGALLLRDAQSVISADSSMGNDGAVDINSPDTDLNPAVMPQDANLGSPPELSANACTAAAAGARSTLVRATRGGVSASPDDYLATLDAQDERALRAAAAADQTSLQAAQAAVVAEGCR